ncbi:MAG: 4-alpha-glucanotransferase [Peptococcaceae bacterium]|nr:4-alpha-glucanotransferase [Peptococcaceae bacterium]MDH7524698.1 4-alpha-glucanotransferase [Peptococcaceae bacterium]
MKLDRASGILLHPTSLPSAYGIGELGKEAFSFVDFLAGCGQKIWQVLPLNPVGFGYSPYQSFSAFAGNHLLISIDMLLEEGLLDEKEVEPIPEFAGQGVDYPVVLKYKYSLFLKAYLKARTLPRRKSYSDFVQKNHYWLYDYAFFMALKEYFNGLPWNQWEPGIAFRKPEALERYGEMLADKIEFHCFLQHLFFSQWASLKRYAAEKGIRLVGDLPLFISYDSADVWVYPHLFELDREGYPARVAGVPPDYFSKTGQRWGNPHYRWKEMARDDYYWWRERFKTILGLVDAVRLDHFRGFEAYWEIPGSEPTAENGKWVKGPGRKFFAAVEKHLGKLPLIAEDLGFITPAVIELRDAFELPGMRVLQFTYEENIDSCRQNPNTVYYTGTHDNDTLWGWYKDVVLSGLKSRAGQGEDARSICWEFIEIVLQSACSWAVIPLQDVLGLDSWARMNTPGTVGGNNWRWRFLQEDLTWDTGKRLAQLTGKHGR